MDAYTGKCRWWFPERIELREQTQRNCIHSVSYRYGSVKVQSVPGKLYSVVWILFGVVMYNVMTSSFTAQLVDAMEDHSDSMMDRKVCGD